VREYLAKRKTGRDFWKKPGGLTPKTATDGGVMERTVPRGGDTAGAVNKKHLC